MEMEEHIWDTSGSYLRGIAVYFLYSPNARKKTLFWRDAKIGFIYSLKPPVQRVVLIVFRKM